METNKSLKRIFVGGLHHTVTESEIKERFSKFGDVSDLEIIIRKDDQGNPVKTFGYVNMSSSETELKKCISLLNKSNWKGGTLQIELAKESFLKKLVQERQDAAKNKNKPQVDSKSQVVESLKKAGVENFHLKSAVPGTEISGHKNWVVSKFGRVLPILHLRPIGQNKIIKYDPSKYCHNIKKLDNSSETQTPISKLTWKMEEQDDEISKKRRGDFTARKCTIKNKASVNDCNKGHSSTSSIESEVYTKKVSSAAAKYNAHRESAKGQLVVPKKKELIASKSDSEKRNVSTNTNKQNIWSKTWTARKDSESEEEFKLLIETEKNKMKELGQKTAATQDVYHLEVVGEDYIPKYNSHWSLNMSKASGTDQRAAADDGEYDSADTDEIIAAERTPAKIIPKMKSSGEEKSMTKNNCQKETCELISNSDEESEEVYSESSLESDYEEMMRNCYRIDLSLADLEQLANNSSKFKTENNEDRSLMPSTSGIKISQHLQAVTINTVSHSAKSAIQSEESSEDEITGNKRLNVVQLPPFRGTKCLSVVQETSANEAEQTTDHCVLKEKRKITQESCNDSTSAPVLKKKKVNKKKIESDSDSDMECGYKPPPFRGTKSLQITLTADPPNQMLNPSLPESKEISCNSNLLNHDGRNYSKDVEGGKETIVPVNSRDSQTLKATPSQAINRIAVSNCLKSENGTVSSSTKAAACRVVSRMAGNMDKHSLDNQKRLAALQRRQEETKIQKNLIQGALSNVDSLKPGSGNHIVFDSEESENEQNEVQNKVILEDDSEDDDSEEEDSSEEKDGIPQAEERGTSQGKLPEAAKEFKIKTVGKLFDSSEDEDMNIDDEIFEIKPQFEGKAGQKLLALQSRFGTDERFRMDERFLDNDEENSEADTGENQAAEKDELAMEKKRNLDILQSLLQVSVKMPKLNKEQAKAKKFRDVSALHYDPTREDHAVFETKVETKKESKAERRKKREVAEKLPEVSKETYFDVAVNLKEIFSSSTKDEGNTEEKKEGDQHQKETVKLHEDSSAQNIASAFPNNTPKEESAGFKFSFFDMDAKLTVLNKELYKAESLNVAKVSWIEDPRFQDSSSEEEEEDLKGQDDTMAQSVEPLLEKKVNLFFFFKDDQRLKDGPELFCHTADLEVQRDDWEEKRTSLIEEFRKKHKDARRKVKDKRYMGVLGEMYK